MYFDWVKSLHGENQCHRAERELALRMGEPNRAFCLWWRNEWLFVELVLGEPCAAYDDPEGPRYPADIKQ